jgi:sugar transferase (PEP-CTERM system associated)
MIIRLFKHHVPLPYLILGALEGLLFVLAPLLMVVSLESPGSGSAQADVILLPQALLFALVVLVCLLAVGLYNSRQRFDFAGQFVRLMVGFCIAIFALAVVFFLLPDVAFGRLELLLSAAYAALGSLVIRFAFYRTVGWDHLKRRILVYGAGRQAQSIAALRRRSDQRGFRLVGYLPAAGDDPSGLPREQILQKRESLSDLCEELAIDEIVVAMDDRRREFPMGGLLECKLAGFDVTEILDFLERESGKVQIDVLNPSWMIFSEGFRRGRLHAASERAFDIIASLLLLALAWPVMLLAAIAIKIEGGAGASVLYRQVRVGQFGKLFRLYKFRSMVENAEAEGEARWAEQNDSRMTRVGIVLRKLRFDELPQVFNVLRGDMSFVGPRPERPEFVGELEDRIPYYRERHNLKPGITGWAQLCYPYGSSEKDAREKLQYDLYYVKNHSLLFYLAILVQTFEVVAWGKGAR